MIQEDQGRGGFLLTYGGAQIPFQLARSDRTRLTIHVHPDLRVEVLAPETASTEAILARVRRRAAWIVRQWRYFEGFLPEQPSRRFVGGETHLYLGRQYRLKVAPADDSGESVKLIGRFLWVRIRPKADDRRVERLVEAWYRLRAREVFARRLQVCLDSSRSFDVDASILRLRKMPRRWGSCTRAGTILLNPDLIKTPVACVDYVIMHELCHLKEPNHGPGFHQLLSRLMPDWRRRKSRLESFAP